MHPVTSFAHTGQNDSIASTWRKSTESKLKHLFEELYEIRQL